jgi:hypothetical protein
MPLFRFKRLGMGDTPCYMVVGDDKTVIGQVRKEKSARLWVAEDAEGTKDFLRRSDAALWLVWRHALRTPPAEHVLSFDQTPAGLIGAPLRVAFKNLWSQLRQERFKDGNISCDICKMIETKKELIDAHEVYSFPDPNTIHLDRLLFVCRPCHYAIHFDRTTRRCDSDYVDEIKEHYMSVNGGLSEEEFDRDFDHSQRRSRGLRDYYRETLRSVSLNFGPYQSRVDALLKKRELRSKQLADDDDSDFEMYPDHECPWDIGRAD